MASAKVVCGTRPCSCAYWHAPRPHPGGGVTRTNRETPDIGVPLVELTADPGALEKERVLTADVEVDVVSMGECGSVSRSRSSVWVTGDAAGRAMDGTSISVSINCGGVWGPGEERDVGEASGSITSLAPNSTPMASLRSSVVIPLFELPGVR